MQEGSLMARTWGGAIQLGALLLGTAAVAAHSINPSGVWILDSARSDLGQCWNVESMTLRVEYIASRVIVVDLLNDQSGGRLVTREFTAFKRAGNTIHLRGEQEPNQFSAQSEQWTLSSDGTRLSIRRQCGQSVHRLVFHRSTTITD
jgi:hypothetical protein